MILFKIIKWLFKIKPDLEYKFLVYFVRKTNGKQMIEAIWGNDEGAEIRVELKGMYIKHLRLQK